MGDRTVSRPDIGVNEHWESIGDNADGLEEHVRGVSVEKAALPTGAATEAALSAISTKLGEVQGSPTSNTLLDRLKALLTGIVLADGSNIIGRVGFDQTTQGTTNAVVVRGKGAASGDTELEIGTAGAHKGAKVLLYAADGTVLFAVPPQLDDTDKLAVSLYGKVTAAGDTALPLDGDPAPALVVRLGHNGIFQSTVAGPPDADNAAMGRSQVAAATQAFNGSTWDRLRAVAASGAGLGVLQVGTLGELITLAASAARTDSANGTAVTGLGWRNRYIILFDLTVADTDAGDTLDVYIDVSLDGTTWLNAVHFTQIVGTDSASKRFAVLDPSAPGTSEILVTADAAAGAVRPSLFGAQMRARWAIVDAGTDDASFTFSVSVYAI